MGLLDFYGKFAAGAAECNACGWTGIGAELNSGETFGDGVDKHCPRCDKKRGFVQWSVTVSKKPPKGWRSTIPRIDI